MTPLLQAGLAGIRRSGVRLFVLLLLVVSVTGCAGRLNKASALFYADKPQKALAELEKGDRFGQRNQLLFLMERGVVLHQLGRYQESADSLLQAENQINRFERLSISEQLSSLITTEWLSRYQGEYSERLWVHTYLMMDFLLLGRYDSALVEAKQSLELFGRYPAALKEAYFSRALIALCFANVAEDNDAYLVYRRLADDLPDPTPVAADLVAISGRLGQLDEVRHYRPYLPRPLPTGAGELVLFVASGRIPRKRPGNIVLPPSIRFSFPYYKSSRSPAVRVEVVPAYPALPVLSTDLAGVVERSLEERKLAIIAKETARVAGKEALAQAVGNERGNAAEAVVRISLFLLEEPDTRSWQMLPGRLTLVRIPLPAGRHRLRLELSSAGDLSRRTINLPAFDLRPGQRVFRSVRF